MFSLLILLFSLSMLELAAVFLLLIIFSLFYDFNSLLLIIFSESLIPAEVGSETKKADSLGFSVCYELTAALFKEDFSDEGICRSSFYVGFKHKSGEPDLNFCDIFYVFSLS